MGASCFRNWVELRRGTAVVKQDGCRFSSCIANEQINREFYFKKYKLSTNSLYLVSMVTLLENLNFSFFVLRIL